MRQFIVSVFIIVFCVLTTHLCMAQNQYLLAWSREQPSAIIPSGIDSPIFFSNEHQKVRVDKDNNVIVGGSSLENGNFNLLIVKYSTNGDLLWKHLIDVDNNSRDYLTEILIDEQNNIVVSAYSKNGEQSTAEAKSVLLKLNTAGQVLWEHLFSDDYIWSFPQGMTLDDNGDIYLTGTANFNWDGKKMFVARFDQDGVLLWDDIYTMDNTGRYEGRAIRIVANSLVSIGHFTRDFPHEKRHIKLIHAKTGELTSHSETIIEGSGPASYHIDNQGNSYVGLFGDFRVIKFDIAGNIAWNFEVPTNLPDIVIADEVIDIISDAEGNIYLTGRHYGMHYNNPVLYTNGDLQVVKVSQQGNTIYNYRYENVGNAFDGGNKLFVGRNNYLVIGGQSQPQMSMNYDYLSIVLDESGVAVDTLRYGLDTEEVIKSVAMDTALNFYVTGTGNGHTLTQKYIFLGSVGSKEINNHQKRLPIGPNPFRDELLIQADGVQKWLEIKLFDTSGRLVFQQERQGAHVVHLEIPVLANGIYFYQILSVGYIQAGKLVRQE